MARLKQWCEDATTAEKEEIFRKHEPKTFADLAASFTEYQD